MAARIQRESRGWTSPWTKRLTREFSPWTLLRAAETSGIAKQSVHSQLPKDRNIEVCQRTKIRRAPCRRCTGGVVDYRYAVVVQDSTTQWIQSYPCTKELRGKLKGAWKSSWTRPRSQYSFALTILWSLARLLKISRGIIAHQPLTVQKRMGLLREHYAELEKGHLLYCCILVWMKIGGRIPWNAIAIRDIFQDGMSDGKNTVWKAIEPLEKTIIPFASLVEYNPVSTKDQSRIHHFGKKILSEDSPVMYCTHGGSGKETYWLWTLRRWKRWTHRKPVLHDSTRKRWYCLIVVKITDSRSQMEQWNLMEETRHWAQPFCYGFFEDNVTKVSLENQNGLHQRLISGCRRSTTWFGSFRETSHAAITLNQESKIYTPR